MATAFRVSSSVSHYRAKLARYFLAFVKFSQNSLTFLLHFTSMTMYYRYSPDLREVQEATDVLMTWCDRNDVNVYLAESFIFFLAHLDSDPCSSLRYLGNWTIHPFFLPFKGCRKVYSQIHELSASKINHKNDLLFAEERSAFFKYSSPK